MEDRTDRRGHGVQVRVGRRMFSMVTCGVSPSTAAEELGEAEAN